ncbi:hypothetical protein DUI87_31088 [Hirundo rustica rustica]|uniref:Uncharacterized protein n=1 Tax=Hirundo rustica rustica TaxID=333673 RepID=A0A3M0J138_HIRRU|nr:hypothetical protein DUI87_31088 [Hirundo rustica rustica]
MCVDRLTHLAAWSQSFLLVDPKTPPIQQSCLDWNLTFGWEEPSWRLLTALEVLSLGADELHFVDASPAANKVCGPREREGTFGIREIQGKPGELVQSLHVDVDPSMLANPALGMSEIIQGFWGLLLLVFQDRGASGNSWNNPFCARKFWAVHEPFSNEDRSQP